MKISKVQLRKWNVNTTDNHVFLDKNRPDTKDFLWSHCYNFRDLTFSIVRHCTAHVMEASLVSVVSFFTDLGSVIFLFFPQSVLGLHNGAEAAFKSNFIFYIFFFSIRYIFFMASRLYLKCTGLHRVPPSTTK